MLKCGIVGLPNVGKSTLFNALLKKSVADVANYPFCTIEPNVGIVEVPDERLPTLAKIVNTQKIVPAAVEFVDIAGLVHGASKGEGLGNQFLSHIRETAVIVHVVRLFENPEVTHVADRIDALDDIQTIETELILADLFTLERQSRPNKKMEKDEVLLYDTVDLLKQKLNNGTPAGAILLTDEQQKAIKPLNLLTSKPVLYIFNVSEAQLEKKQETNENIQTIIHEGGKNISDLMLQASWIYLCAKLESEIVGLSPEEQTQYLSHYDLEESGLNRLIKTAYEQLDLISFLTAGVKEVRAWTIRSGTTAQQSAGVIHTDFVKHFIKADVIAFDQFVQIGGWVNAREKGMVKSMGRDYIVQDGDVIEFKVGI